MHDDPIKAFAQEKIQNIARYSGDEDWKNASLSWLTTALMQRYVYNFSWLGRPIIQLPTDIVAFQEIVWEVKPDLIIEMGVAHGGSLILSASMLALLDYCDAVEQGIDLSPTKASRKVLGVDIDIRSHNKSAIKKHPLSHKIELIEGSSIAEKTIEQVHQIAKEYSRVLVCLDSNHTRQHVFEELKAYAPLVSKGSYCITFDTIIEDLPEDFYPDRPWAPQNSPKNAVYDYLDLLNNTPQTGVDREPLIFKINKDIESKIMLTVAPEGFLLRV